MLILAHKPVLDDPEQDILHLTPNLRIKCRKHFLQVQETAKKLGLEEAFNRAFQIAHQWTEHGDRVVEIYSDFAPLSFGYAILAPSHDHGHYTSTVVIAGGLIYQGPDIPANGSFPSLTVSMDPTRVGWFFHS